jgi:cytochrome c biogenesis protein CcmG/thiol:disulfide interchange protein DsbE
MNETSRARPADDPAAASQAGRDGAGQHEPARIRAAAARAGRVIRGNKILSGISAAFVVAIIVVSVVTTGSAPPSHPVAHGFTLPALGHSGQQVSLSQYQGKPVIINFWASWCPPCQQETPLLASWYKQQDGQVALLGLDENDTSAAALKFTAAKGVTYPIGFDPNTTVALDYNADNLPQTFFLNAQHRIVDHVLGAVTKAELAKGLSLMKSAS